MTARPELRIVEDAAELARAGAEVFARTAEAAAAARGRFVVALAGGRTPGALYERLAGSKLPPYRERLPWDRTLLVIGDERPVPPEHPESNFGMVRATLLERIPFPEERICRFFGEWDDPPRAAERFERELREKTQTAPGATPRLDLVLLGLGPDAHTASLFPGSPALDERERLAAAPWVGSHGSYRLTVTPPLINAARRVVFLVSGSAKASALRNVLEQPRDPARWPAQIVVPTEGQVLWLVDRAAAGPAA